MYSLMKDGRPETTRERKEAFLSYLNRLSKYPRDGGEMHQTTASYVRRGLIPWPSPGSVPEDSKNHNEIHNDYFITVFISTGSECVLADEDELREMLESREDNTFNPQDFPSDGSRGQAKAANGIAIKTIRWFLGEWDGDYDPYDDPNSTLTRDDDE